VATDRAMVKRH